MTAERWQRVQGLFEAALSVDPAGRAAFLDHSCGLDVELRREVDTLLACDADQRQFLIHSTRASTALFDSAVISARIGHRVGAYELVRPLATGGMGAVWLAERADDQFKKQVAIKLIRPELATGEMHRRFRTERQLLANLSHPNIARFLDGGVTDQGLPYFVMEYIDGVAIDRYCDERTLGLGGRLDLFLQVCAAVQTAHQSLIIHRDLKPANILVTQAGVPVLLDFGIAKVIGADPDPTNATIVDARPMTPAYASPEQLAGRPVTTASDIYSLGLILYELLTGKHPFADGRSVASDAVTSRTRGPRRPSAQVIAEGERSTPADGSTPQSSPQRNSALRGADPRRLRRQLIGDLDTITLKALAADPRARYASVEQFADDIRRHLARRPIRARPATLSYRAAQFVRRNPLGVSVTAVVLGGFVALGAYIAQQAREVAHQRDAAVAAEARATVARTASDLAAANASAEANRAAHTAALVLKLLANIYANPGENTPARLREALEEAALQIEAAPPGDPTLEADVHRTLGRAFISIGARDAAVTELERALALRRSALVAGDAQLIGPLNELGALYLAIGRVPEAQSLFREAIELVRSHHGATHEDELPIANQLAEALLLDGRPGSAKGVLRTADPNPASRAGETAVTCLIRLAQIEVSTGNSTDANEMADAALLAARSQLGDAHPLVGEANLLFAEAQGLDGAHLERADVAARLALEILRSAYGAHDRRTAHALVTGAGVKRATGDLAGAEFMVRQSLETYRQLGLASHPESATATVALAGLMAQNGDLSAAETLWREALDIRRTVFGDLHMLTASTQRDLAALLIKRGDLPNAEHLLGQAVTVFDALKTAEEQTPDHELFGRERILALSALAALYEQKMDFAAALPILREAVAASILAVGAAHPDSLSLRTRQSVLLMILHENQEANEEWRAMISAAATALAAFDQRLATHVAQLGAIPAADPSDTIFWSAARAVPELIRTLTAVPPGEASTHLIPIGAIFAARNQNLAAEEVGQMAVQMADTLPPERRARRGDVYAAYGAWLMAAGRSHEAEPLLKTAAELSELAFASSDPQNAQVEDARALFAESLIHLGKFGEAEKILIRGYDRFRNAGNDEQWRRIRAVNLLQQLYKSWGKPAEAARWAALAASESQEPDRPSPALTP